MNNPWPTRSELRCEELVNRLLDEQAAADAAFRDAVSTALTAIKRLEFPLGCPAPGYDMGDVTGALADWLMPLDEQTLANLAADVANDMLLDEAA